MEKAGLVWDRSGVKVEEEVKVEVKVLETDWK